MKSLIASDALLVYPHHNNPFHIKTDANDFQLGAIIKQDNCPVADCTHKLNSAQTKLHYDQKIITEYC